MAVRYHQLLYFSFFLSNYPSPKHALHQRKIVRDFTRRVGRDRTDLTVLGCPLNNACIRVEYPLAHCGHLRNVEGALGSSTDSPFASVSNLVDAAAHCDWDYF